MANKMTGDSGEENSSFFLRQFLGNPPVFQSDLIERRGRSLGVIPPYLLRPKRTLPMGFAGSAQL